MVRHSLYAMARGGIHDLVGGGFARYTVDEHWLIPHFEKMLYDNALLGRLYARGAQVTGEADFAAVARDTLDYLLADLALPGGGFASAEDADSEGEEGRFYTFTWDEFRAAAGDGLSLAAAALGATPEGNFEGRNVLHRARPPERVAADRGASLEAVTTAVDLTLAGLRSRRARRVRPARDDKAVASWNGLAMRALAEAGTVLGEARYLEAAADTARFALTALRRADGRLLRSRRDERGDVPGFCEDYAALALGLFALFRADGGQPWFQAALSLVDDMTALFADPATGAFFATGEDAPTLIARPLNLSDHPTPSDNALAAEALLTAAAYTGERAYADRADAVFRAAGVLFDRAPAAAGHLAAVLSAALAPAGELAVVGPAADPATAALLAVAEEQFRPALFVARGDGLAGGVVPLLQGRGLVQGRPAAYLCRNLACAAPVTDAEELRRLLQDDDYPVGGRRVAP
jgi:hypothetical protein